MVVCYGSYAKRLIIEILRKFFMWTCVCKCGRYVASDFDPVINRQRAIDHANQCGNNVVLRTHFGRAIWYVVPGEDVNHFSNLVGKITTQQLIPNILGG